MIKILIADDQLIIAKGLKLLLSPFTKFEIVGIVKNGQEAIDFVDANDVDIVLMDINMPVLDGIQATQAIAQLFPEVKVIILSMHAEQTYIDSAKLVGAKEYVSKCCRGNSLGETIVNVSEGNYWEHVRV